MTGRNISILLLVGITALGVAWIFERKQDPDEQAVQTMPVSTRAPVSVQPAPGASDIGLQPLRQQEAPAMPSAHPPIDSQSAGVVTPDPDAQYTHFQVGERNVRRLVSEGDIIWVGTSGGVIRYNTANDQFRHFSTHMGLIANGVFHLSRWRDTVAIGTYGGGLSLLDESSETFKHYNIPHGLADAFVYDMVESEDGDLWIATWSGANFIKDGDLDDPAKWQTFTVENTSNGLPNDWVYALSRGENGVIWFATEGGLARFKDGLWNNWSHKDGLGADYELVKDEIQFQNDPAQYSEHHSRQKVEMDLQQVDVAYNPNYIVALAVTKGDIVWAGTWGGGLARFDGKKWTNFTTHDGLPSNHVFMLYEGRDGRMWVGTGKGLARMEADGSFTVFNTSHGLFSDIVFSMVEAEDGSLWIGSYGGVTHMKSLP